MSTPSPYLPLFVFDSATADGHFTRLQIDPNEASLISVGMYPQSEPDPVFEFPFSPPSTPDAPADLGLPLFLITFTRYDLVTNQLCDQGNLETQDYVTYSVDPEKIRARETFVRVERTNAQSRIIYSRVRPSHHQPAGPSS